MGRKIVYAAIMIMLTASSVFSQNVKELRNIGIGQITVIEEANNQDLWVGSESQGVAFYSGTMHTWSYFNTVTVDSVFKSDSITSISYGLIGGVQSVFIGTTNGMAYNHGGTWDTVPLVSNSYADRYITGVALIASDTVWASTRNGILGYDTGTLQIKATFTTANSNVPYNHTICSERHGQSCTGYSVGTPDSGAFYTTDGTSFTKIDTSGPDFKLVDNRVNTICIDNNCMRRLIGTKGGFSICPTGVPCQNFTTANGLPENNVTSISMDCHGNIWVGTSDSGVVIFNNMADTIVGRLTVDSGLTSDQVTSVSFGGGVCTGYVSTADGNLALVDSNYQVVQIINGLNTVSQPDFDVRVYPQPSGSQVNFLFGRTLTDGELYLTDISGRTLKSININNTSMITTDVSSLPDGLYFYRINSSGQLLKTGKIDVMK